MNKNHIIRSLIATIHKLRAQAREDAELTVAARSCLARKLDLLREQLQRAKDRDYYYREDTAEAAYELERARLWNNRYEKGRALDRLRRLE